MDMKYDVSVIILTYNPSLKSLITTLISILKQKECSFQIIISDDGSKANYFDIIEQIFKYYSFEDYILLPHNKNGGTVKNLFDSIGYCEAEYVKYIGQGDLLYNHLTLKKLLDIIKKKDMELVYGDAIPFSIANNKASILNIKLTPQRIKCYKEGNRKKIFKNYLICNDVAAGSTVFGRKEFITKYLSEGVGVIKLAEDLLIKLMICDNKKVGYVDAHVTFYETDSGISHSEKRFSVSAIDNKSFYHLLFDRLPKDMDAGHIKKVLQKRLVFLEKTETKSKIDYLFSDIAILMFHLERLIHGRKITDTNKSYLDCCYKETSQLLRKLKLK